MENRKTSALREWRRLKTGQRQDFRILSIREDDVADPRNGKVHPRVIIECPDWVHVFAVTRAEEAILIRQFRFGTWSTTLEVPGGIVDPGESPEQAAARELLEETGYTAQELRPVGFIHPNPAIQTNRCYTFVAKGCVQTSVPQQDDGEDIAVELLPRDAIPALISSGQITHALVVAGYCLVRGEWGQ